MLDRAGIAAARLRTPAELFDHPQLVSRDRVREVATPGGPVRVLVPPVTVRGREPLIREAPALGADNDPIRREFSA
jgi:itaconate CoA-transferase